MVSRFRRITSLHASYFRLMLPSGEDGAALHPSRCVTVGFYGMADIRARLGRTRSSLDFRARAYRGVAGSHLIVRDRHCSYHRVDRLRHLEGPAPIAENIAACPRTRRGLPGRWFRNPE